jgi:hypothetical protein
MKKILFYNDWHNGDIHMSREYVKDLMSVLGQNEYFYYHTNNNSILSDIDNLKYTNNKNITTDLNINTWIGQFWRKNNNFNGCNFQSYYNVMKELYGNLGIFDEIKPIEHYIPSINYSKFNVFNSNIDSIKGKRNILFCNNLVNSKQSTNFDFSEIINLLGNNFPNINFIVTNKEKNIKETDNVFYTTNIIKGNNNFDLNEISYLSTHCDFIIGRSSGPYSFSVVKENILIKKKKFICFTNTINDCWYLNDLVDLVWSNNYNYENIINIIKNELIKL